MTGTRRLTAAQVQRLARDLHAFVLSRADRLAESEGVLTFKVYPKGQGFDITVNASFS